LTADSSRELPTNWLYRRGYVDPATGLFTATHPGGEVASTAWWVDFSNYFEGVATLGGGNVSLLAGGDIVNVDAAAATNARMPKGTPNAKSLLELGGGDVTVKAGGDISGGRMSLGQLFTRPGGFGSLLDPYATPDPRIFIASASTPPGAGVHGMCGWHAAQSALRRLG